MSDSVLVAWDDAFTAYDFGYGHPMQPLRLELTMALARGLGVLDHPHVALTGAEPASDAVLELVHDPAYVEAVRRAGARPWPDPAHQLGTGDNPVFAGMHDASARIAAGSVAAALAVVEGRHDHAVNLAGGLHHAMRDHASGFCIYNDPALAIATLLRAGAERVAYVDIDAHHGDGVQAAFWDEPRVLTVSLHESGRTLFPGTGFSDEIGGPGAEGTAANLALPSGTADAAWLRAFHAVVPPLLRAFRPQVLVTQHGCDSHALDPITHLDLHVDGQRAAAAALHALAHELTGGRWVALGGGGYSLVQVVPRAWTHVLAEVVGRPVEPHTPTPEAWRERVLRSSGEPPPTRMTDGVPAAYEPWSGPDPDDPVDRAVVATRAAVFGPLGLDPEAGVPHLR